MNRGERVSLPKSGTIPVTPGWSNIEKVLDCHPQLLVIDKGKRHRVESYHRGTKKVDIIFMASFHSAWKEV